jgi:hypothetical protein
MNPLSEGNAKDSPTRCKIETLPRPVEHLIYVIRVCKVVGDGRERRHGEGVPALAVVSSGLQCLAVVLMRFGRFRQTRLP